MTDAARANLPVPSDGAWKAADALTKDCTLIPVQYLETIALAFDAFAATQTAALKLNYDEYLKESTAALRGIQRRNVELERETAALRAALTSYVIHHECPQRAPIGTPVGDDCCGELVLTDVRSLLADARPQGEEPK